MQTASLIAAGDSRALRRAPRGRRPVGATRRCRADARLPAEALTGLRCVADEVVQLGLAALQRLVDPHVLLPVEPDVCEGDLRELADGVQLPGGDHVVARFVATDDAGHRIDVVAGVAPR